MANPFGLDVEKVPLHVLFPEDYRASAQMVARDFAYYGICIVAFVLGLALFFG